MNETIISGDIVASTSLSNKGKVKFETSLRELLADLNSKFGVFGRVIKGDYVECYVPRTENALCVALIIKSFVKSIRFFPEDEMQAKDKRIKFFNMHGIRLAIGFGELSRLDTDKGIIDGEAIYFSGRALSGQNTYNKEKIVIKNTLFFVSNFDDLNDEFDPMLALLDVLMRKATTKQSHVLFLKLMGFSEESIAEKLKIGQSTVNQHSTSVGWNAIEKAVKRFGQVIKAR
jgi:hypothetical protein